MRYARWLLIVLAACPLLCAAPAPIADGIRVAEQTHVDIYRRLSPAVVGITCNGTSPATKIKSGFFGTGVCISADGLILTSTSVIPNDATEIKVFFTDGHVRPAELKKFDEPSEGVLIKIEATKLPFMKLANSKEYKVGDPVYSWGNPHFTIQRDGVVSLSTGVISGLYETCSVDDQSRYVGPVVETDAAVNPGSDGGPLTDAEGNLLGIMSLAFSRTRWLGLAIPTARLAEGVPDLKPLMTAKRPVLIGPMAQTWALQKAFLEVSARAERATVAVRVMREDETDEPPPQRTSEGLKPQQPIPTQARPLFEARRPAQGANTGLVVSADGTVITASYNVDDTAVKERPKPVRPGPAPAKPPPPPKPRPKIKKIFLYLADGSRVEARILAVHKAFGIAALKFDPPSGKTPDFVEVADAAPLLPGSSVALLGRSEPPGAPTLNAGRVSAVTRVRETCCQISCLLNYGNLGGPVIDLHGRVVGISTHLTESSAWRQNCGVGFMLKGELIRQALPDLVAGKSTDHVRRAIIGVEGDSGALDVKGARVARVMPNTPADKAGIKAGDIIIGFNDKEIADWNAVTKELRAAKPGDDVTIKVQRGAEKLDLAVELGEGE